MTEKEKLKMLIEAIDYSFLNTQGEYDKELTYPVIDKVKFIKKSMQEEPVSIWHDASEKPERDDLLIETNDGRIIHRQSINNYGMVKRWAYTSALLNLDNSCNLGNNSQEEPVSGLDNGDMPVERWKQAVEAASNQRSYRSSKGLTETRDDYFVDGVQWADEHPKEEPVSDDLKKAHWNAAIKYDSKIPFGEYLFRAGVNWKREQMMKGATEAIVKVDAGGYPYIPQIELYDYNKDVPLAKDGDKYKIILIKEE